MPTYSLRRFSDVNALKTISPEHLLKLLHPHKEYFAARDLKLPSALGPETLDYEALTRVFMTPDVDTPKELNDALFFINEMSDSACADELLEELEKHGIKFDTGASPTPADIAVRTWLCDREILERKHAEQFSASTRSFEYYQIAAGKVPAFKTPTSKQLKALESDLDDWFEKKKRGRGTRVFLFQRPDEVWFMVRHGELYKREGSLNKGKSESVYYRPEKHDVLTYDCRVGEIRINAASKKEKELYRNKFGLHLFGNEEFFPGTSKYTLEPLKTDGADSLACDDIEGMDWIRLKEIKYHWGGPHGEIETRTADDLFAAWAERKKGIHPKARIIRASFLVKFADSKVARTVTIRPSNVANYKRDDDAAVIESFLVKRGFVVTEAASEAEEPEENAASIESI